MTTRKTRRPAGRGTGAPRTNRTPRHTARQRASRSVARPNGRRSRATAPVSLELALRPGFRAGTPDPRRPLRYGAGTPDPRRALGYGPGTPDPWRAPPPRTRTSTRTRTEEMAGPDFFPASYHWEPMWVEGDTSGVRAVRMTSPAQAVAAANALEFSIAPPAEPYGQGRLRVRGAVPTQGCPREVQEAWREAYAARKQAWVEANLRGRAVGQEEHQVGGWDSGYPPTYSTQFWWDEPAHFLGGYLVSVNGAYGLWGPMGATPEVKARVAARDALRSENDVYRQMEASSLVAGREMEVRSGDLAIVVKGNKVPLGTIGVVAGIFDGSYGQRARLVPLDDYGRAIVRGGGADTYIAVANLAPLMGRDEVRPAPVNYDRADGRRDRVDFNAPVSEAARRVFALGSPAWPWALRDAAPCAPVMDPLLPTRLAWTCSDCRNRAPCGLRHRRAKALLLDYVALMAADPMVVGVATVFRDDPPKLDETTPRTLHDLLDALQSSLADVLRYGQEFSDVGGALAFLNDKAPAAAQDATRASLRNAILSALGYTYQAPTVGARGARAGARKGTTGTRSRKAKV